MDQEAKTASDREARTAFDRGHGLTLAGRQGLLLFREACSASGSTDKGLVASEPDLFALLIGRDISAEINAMHAPVKESNAAAIFAMNGMDVW